MKGFFESQILSKSPFLYKRALLNLIVDFMQTLLLGSSSFDIVECNGACSCSLSAGKTESLLKLRFVGSFQSVHSRRSIAVSSPFYKNQILETLVNGDI